MICLGIDCGTQSTKAIAVDWETGEVLAEASRSYGFLPGLPPGALEQDPRDWSRAADESVGEVVAALGVRREEIRGIGVSGQQHGLVVLDDHHEIVRPAKLWCDTSTVAQCEEITAHFGGPVAVIEMVGNTMRPGYTAPKILWLQQNEPENWRRTRSILLPHDYLNFWLTGVLSMEYGDASGTALLDVKQRAWHPRMLDYIAPDLAAKLPPLASSHSACGVLREELRQRWGLPTGVVVSAGGGDNMMAAIGTGNVLPGAVTASLGTSGTLFASSAFPIVDPQGEVAGFCDSTGQWLPLVCTMNLTLVTEHVRKMFGWDYAELDRQVTSTPAGAGGLLMLPYLTGERTPDLPQSRGLLQGLTLENFSPGHLARAAMESVTLGLGHGLRRMRDLGIEATEVRLTGGGSRSAAWRQICADVFGLPVVCPTNEQGAAFGAALQAGWTWSATEGSGETLASIAERLTPVDESTRQTPVQAGLYADLLTRTRHLLNDLQTIKLP